MSGRGVNQLKWNLPHTVHLPIFCASGYMLRLFRVPEQDQKLDVHLEWNPEDSQIRTAVCGLCLHQRQ